MQALNRGSMRGAHVRNGHEPYVPILRDGAQWFTSSQGRGGVRGKGFLACPAPSKGYYQAENLLPASRLGGKFVCVIDWSQCSAVERQPGKVSGAWVFKGTRLPVRALFENLQGGARIEDFLEWFPGVTRDQVDAVLKLAEQSLDVVPA